MSVINIVSKLPKQFNGFAAVKPFLPVPGLIFLLTLSFRASRQITVVQVVFFVCQWFFSGNEPELVIKVRDIVVAAFVTDFGNIFFVFYQQTAGCAYPYFHQKAYIGLLCGVFKIPAKRLACHIQNARYHFDGNFFCIMTERIVEHQFYLLSVCITGRLHKSF